MMRNSHIPAGARRRARAVAVVVGGVAAACSLLAAAPASAISGPSPRASVSLPATGQVGTPIVGSRGTSATSGADQYTYIASAPTVAGIFPHRGFAAGGGRVLIGGTGFTGATGVAFGGTAAAAFTVYSDNHIIAIAPAGTGTVDVTVTTPAGTSATSSADQYTYRPDPTRLIAHPATVTAAGSDISLNPSATLIDRVTGTPAAGQTIAFTVGSQPVCTAVTDAMGDAGCTGTVPQTVPMAYFYRAEFAGTDSLAGRVAWGRLVQG